jgi:16S rRNA (adenine1518-N6/adenine1519-N6)-dimethyltransferase
VALCDATHGVVAIEKDDDLAPVLAETTSACPRLSVVHDDALRVTAEAVAAPFGRPNALVSNLPYAVAATVVLRFFEEMESISQATVMVQSEVACRMAAQPGSKEYGAYTVKLRLFARPAGRFTVPPGCFLPPPRVDSAVIRLERVQPACDPDTRVLAARVADAAFAQRRKTIRNSLRATFGESAQAIDDALERAGIDGAVRAETLEPEAFIELARSFQKAR